MSSIPIDLIVEILSRLPQKSVDRFRCVSKQWGSILCCPYFTELFLTRSSARPRLLFVFYENSEWSFYSSPQPQKLYGKQSSLKVDAHIRMEFSKHLWWGSCGYASGLISFLHEGPKIRYKWRSNEDIDNRLNVICNPSTGQYIVLPKIPITGHHMIKTMTYKGGSKSLLGFGPIDKIFKVLFIDEYGHNNILTLETGKMSWRKIQCSFNPCSSMFAWICINGVLYYIADKTKKTSPCVIVCFYVRSEKVKLIDTEWFSYHSTRKLINYKGKLGGVDLDYRFAGGSHLCLWVLEDAKKGKWSKSVYTLLDVVTADMYVAGVTATGEIVLACRYKPFYVLCFDPERNTLQRVEIEGFGDFYDLDRLSVKVFVDHVEDLNLQDAKLYNSSQCLDIISTRPIPPSQASFSEENKRS